jgi:nucleotide-binding universal stress UspA family protein
MPGSPSRDTIVVGYAKGPGDTVVEQAVAEARRRHARVVVVHSMESGPEGEREIRHYQEHKTALEAVDALLREADVPGKAGMHVRGLSPAEDLAQTVREEEASLLVIGYRRRSRTSKYLLGSDTQEILIACPCPVLAIGHDLV